VRTQPRAIANWVGRRYPVLPFRGRLSLIQGSTEAIPDGEVVSTREGILIRVKKDAMYRTVYYWGDYEPLNTKVYRRIIRSGDTVVDVGANFGWFTACFARWVGKAGCVHAFEPIPHIHAKAAETVGLNGLGERVRLNLVALGNEESTMSIFTFAGLPHGHASATDLGREDAVPHRCPVRRLDTYCRENGIESVRFVKVDVEGFEREVFLGAERLLSGDDAPIIAFELNVDCLTSRGITSNDVVSVLRDFGYSEFFSLSVKTGVKRLERVGDVAGGDCVAAQPGRASDLRNALKVSRLFR
jgi:FkbM family methyltransferase